MKREIKFRVWSNNLKRYLTADEPMNRLAIFKDHEYSYHRLETYLGYKNDLEIQQFTGLLDKNGKEIYEGDIVKNNRKWSFGLNAGSYFVVEFNVETGRYGLLLRGERLRDSWEDLAALTRKKSNECEVIGNIYENPEFLEK